LGQSPAVLRSNLIVVEWSAHVEGQDSNWDATGKPERSPPSPFGMSRRGRLAEREEV
jgi:hypothetical protein